nr:tRNA1(Val) (adenine(37)-N6)-methyltransferase [Roseburia sp. AM51-8]
MFWYGCCAFVRLCKVKRGEEVLDLGTGTGIIPILLEAKTEGQHFTGLEIQPESADMAARSVAYNHLEDRVSIVTGDIKDATNIFGASSFDVVTCNPPYMTDQHGIKNDGDAKTIARHEVLCNLEDVVSQTAKLLRPGGRCYFVHRPFRLVEILSTMSRYKVEPKRMQLVYPYVDKEPNMVLIEGMRDGKSRITVEKPLIVYQSPGVYMPESTIFTVIKCLRDKSRAKITERSAGVWQVSYICVRHRSEIWRI